MVPKLLLWTFHSSTLVFVDKNEIECSSLSFDTALCVHQLERCRQPAVVLRTAAYATGCVEAK